jgi:hypothetical protein
MEAEMLIRRSLVALLLALFTAGFASADYKVVKQTHRDGFSIMGHDQPATDREEVMWIGADRMRNDQGSASVIIRLDTKKMIIVNHTDQTYSVVDLPLDVSSYLPPQMAEQMMAMMKLDVTVTPTDEHKKIGEWNARRYDMTMSSQMISMEATMWATTDVKLDWETYRKMFAEILSLQPGADAMGKEMEKVDGLVVAQDSTMSMAMAGNTTIASTEKVTSAEKTDPPAGTYDPPAGYTEKPFDFMNLMQQKQ